MAKQKTTIVVEGEQDATEMFAEIRRVSRLRASKAAESTPAMCMVDNEAVEKVLGA
jgi:hypothetical protein